MISIQQLLAPVSATAFRQGLVNNLKTLGVPADQWRAGGIASSLLTVVSMTLAGLSSGLTTILQGFFLPTATGSTLQLLAFYVYGITAPAATFASGRLVLTNSGGGVYSVGVGQYTALNPVTGVTYTNTVAFNLGAVGSATATASVPVSANVQGSAGNAAPNTITQQVTTLLGVSITNPASLIGIDPISDDALRTLCLNSLGARSVRGPRTAYAYAIQIAVNPVTNSPVNINRWQISSSSHTGTVTVIVASPSGGADSNDVAGVVTSIEANARPDAVTVTVSSATPLNYSPTLNVTAIAGVGISTTTIAAAIQAQLGVFFENYPIGGVTATDDTGTSTGLFLSGVYGAVALGCAQAGATLAAVQGATDLTLTSTEVAVNATTINVSIISSQGNA